jgi:hypothetical protein
VIPREIRRLPEAEALRRWAELYVAGKHKGYAQPWTGQYAGRDDVWVEVEVPHDFYDADWNTEDADPSPARMKLSEEYARRGGQLPPGMAGFNARRARSGVKKIYVSDGNHRAYAAFLRGSPTARFYMPLKEWTAFRETLEA